MKPTSVMSRNRPLTGLNWGIEVMRVAKICMALAAPVAVMSAASDAKAATIIDFNNIGSPDMPVFFESVAQDGFLLTNSVPQPDTFFTWVQGSGFNADHGGYTAVSNYNGSYIISRSDGTAFDFVSVDLADGADNVTGGLARSVDFTSRTVRERPLPLPLSMRCATCRLSRSTERVLLPSHGAAASFRLTI